MDSLLEAVWPQAYRVARGILRDSSLAEDVSQDACATMYRKLATLRTAEAFPSWFYRIIVRASLKVAESRHERSAELIERSTPTQDATDVIDLRVAMDRLPVKLRTPLVLKFFAGLSSREIGHAIGIPSPTVRFRIAIAKRRLHDALQPNTLQPEKVNAHA